MISNKVWLILASQLLMAFPAQGAMKIVRVSPSIEAVIEETGIPIERITKNLTSGFTTVLVARFSLKQLSSGMGPSRTEVISVTDLTVAGRYDLWDEFFWISRVGPMGSSSKKVKNLNEAIAEFKSLQTSPFKTPTGMDRQANYQVEASLVLDPIQKDRLETIHKWLSKHNLDTSGVASGLGAGRLFSSLLDDALKTGFASLTWRADFKTDVFRIEEVK